MISPASAMKAASQASLLRVLPGRKAATRQPINGEVSSKTRRAASDIMCEDASCPARVRAGQTIDRSAHKVRIEDSNSAFLQEE